VLRKQRLAQSEYSKTRKRVIREFVGNNLSVEEVNRRGASTRGLLREQIRIFGVSMSMSGVGPCSVRSAGQGT